MGTIGTINRQHDELSAAQRAQLKAQYEKSAAEYQKQLNGASSQYQSLKNEAYVNHALAERTRRENMANMGLSGAGGTSQTIAQRNTGSLLGTLGDASRQQQDYTDNIKLALENLGVQYNSDLLSLAADTEAGRNAALREQQRWETQNKQAQQKSVFDQAYSLYRNRLITAAQFTRMTGIKLRRG